MLTEITPTESVNANHVARNTINGIISMSTRIVAIRTEGIPAVAAVPATLEQTLPDGRVIPARPARPATPAISAAAINAALGQENCDLLEEIKNLIF